MAKTDSRQKNGTKQLVVIAFVVVCMSLLAIQIGVNVREALNQQSVPDSTIEREGLPTSTPAGPTPTIDFSAPVSEDGF